MDALGFVRLKTALLTAVLSSTPAAVAAQDIALRNGGFEVQDDSDPTVPASWVNDKAEAGFRLNEADHRDGQRSLEIRFDKDMSTSGYSGAIQRAANGDLAGRTFTLRGWLKRDNTASAAGLWIAFVDAEGKRLSYVNDYEVLWADATGWNLRTIRSEAPPGAQRLVVGVSIFEATGTLLVDDITLETSGP
jgi:hypothetical protein